MAITDTQKVDYLFKKLGFAVTKTDTNSAKAAANESIASPLLLRGDKVWQQAGDIPATIPGSSSAVVQVYTSAAPVECTGDITATADRTWKTGSTDWIPPEFGSTYLVNVYVHTSGDAGNAADISNKVFIGGSGNNDEWFFDYQSGVLHFIGTNLPNGVNFTGKSVYITGAKYIGNFGVGSAAGEDTTLGDLTASGTTITATSAGDDIILKPENDGVLDIDTDTAIILPVGTSAQRPSTPLDGMLRFNDDDDKVEVYDGTDWVQVGSSAGEISTQAFAADGSTVAFTLNSAADSATVMVTLNGVVQEPTIAYSVSGTTLTFVEAPAVGDRIEVRKLGLVTTIRAISDSDSDTKIQVEEGADDDTIRFDTAGTERAVVDAGGLTIKAQGDLRLGDSDSSHYIAFQAPATVGTNVTFTVPASDGTNGQALVTDGSGTLSFGAAGATITNDESTNAERLVYVGSVTSGALTAATQDSGFTYNPSTGKLTASAFAGALTGDVTGNSDTATTLETARNIGGVSFDGSGNINLPGVNASGNQDTSGNAATATVLETARNIGGVSFDGSGDITLPGVNTSGNQDTSGSAATLSTPRAIALIGDVVGTANFDGSAGISISTVIQADSVALGTDTTGNYVSAGATSGNGISGSVSNEGGIFAIESNATTANTANTIVFRDASGDFSANVITATTTSARYADLAEMYATDGDIEAGTVVHFAGQGKVAECDTANCSSVAGIISTDPAHLMNADQEGVALALAGRVPCKVTGVVNAGDLMVSAGNGMAMSNNNASVGTIIGKAIEAHEGGEGVIEVIAKMM